MADELVAHHLRRMRFYPVREDGSNDATNEDGRPLFHHDLMKIELRLDQLLSPCEAARVLDTDGRDGKDDGSIQAGTYHAHKKLVPKKDLREVDIAVSRQVRILLHDQVVAYHTCAGRDVHEREGDRQLVAGGR